MILAGGTSRRLRADRTLAPGTLPPDRDKTDLRVGRRTLLEHVLDGCPGADRVALVGPVRPVRVRSSVVPSVDRLLWCRESPPGAGPLAALAAGVTALSAAARAAPAPLVVVLGGDMPFVGGAVPHLLTALTSRPAIDAAALARRDGGRHSLALAVRRPALTTALMRLGDPTGRPLHQLLSMLELAAVPDAEDWAFDVDDAADLRAAQARVAASAGTSHMMSP